MVPVYPCSRVYMASVWFVVVLVLSTGGFTQGVQHCLQCLQGESTSFCNASSNLQQCGSDNDMCYAKVSNIGGKLFTAKGCIFAQLCHQAATQNDLSCDQGIALGLCTYCCIGDSCNYDRFEYSSSIPVSTPTTAISTTSSLLTSLAPSTCENENLTRCTKDYEEAVLVAMKDPRTNFPFFCRQVPVMFQCIAEAMASCCPDNQLALHDQLNSVSDIMWSQCPRECDVVQGELCTSGTLTKVISKVIVGSCSCETLRTYMLEYQKCLVINVGTCGSVERVGFEYRAKVIKSAIEVICTDPSPTQSPPYDVTTELPTSGPGCEPDIVNECLLRLAINLTQPGGPDYDVICGTVLPETENCFMENTYSCPPSTKEGLEHAFNFTRALMTENCTATTEPPAMCDTTAARTCAVEIWRVIDEVGDYGLACSMVKDTVECVLSNVTGCTDREKQSLNRTLEIVLKRLEGQCDKIAELEGECSNIRLDEGGGEWPVRFSSNYDPKHLCGGEDDCKVYVQVVVEKTDSPKCKNGDAIPQLVCRPEPKPKSGPACGVRLTSDNWKETHTIYLAAALDNKVDGDKKIQVKLLYTKVIKGQVVEVMTLETCEVTVIDHDTSGQCACLNDPHIKTFDDTLYDNFLEGIFVLYRHTKLPYEVQVLFQKCGPAATCTCGVAIKSGDYVFFAERCRRKKPHCRKGRKCKNLLKAKSFVWDEVTDGTRLFTRPDGYEILLPHGTRVIIQYQKKLGLINVWVSPSGADYKNTTGLCGVYDGSRDKDLVLPNGDPYTGPNVGQHKHPKDFCKAWRIEEKSEWLHKGAPYNPYYPPQYCVCEDQWCQKVDCSARHLASTCDINTEGEILFEEMPKINGEIEIARRKRAVEDEADFDFDIDYEPEEIDPSTRQWTEQAARTFCQAYMDGSNVVGLCQFQAGVEVLHYVNICVQDILLADDTKWAISALEGVKAECVNIVESDPKFSDSDINKHVVVQIGNANCPMECSDQGSCDEGKCQCEDNFVGETCDVKADAVPSYISADYDGLCNSRMTDCSYIVIYADDIIKTNKLTCHLSAVEVTEAGVSNTTNSIKIKAQYFSSNQVICSVHSSTLSRGYYIDLSNDGQRVSGEPLLYVAHDPHCFDCKITDDGATCARKSDTCVVDGKCYLSGETDSEDACSMCDPASSTSTLRKDKSLACLGPFAMIIIACVAIVLVILSAIVIWYCCCHKRNNEKSYKSRMEEGVANELIRRKKVNQ